MNGELADTLVVKRPRLNTDCCVECGACVAVCRSGALSLDTTTWALVHSPRRCTGCGDCVAACPVGAIEEGAHASG